MTDSVRAAIYVRMSTEHQQYSTENQSDVIREYAAKRGIEIVRTYADAGKSGLRIAGRDALKELIDTVLGGTADFQAILVYDVSRWGRFQDADESAYYEYICKRAGITVHYTPAQIAEKVGVTESWTRGILRLHAKGEEVLLAAVERGDIPINVAVEIAWAKDQDVRRCLAEAYEREELRGKEIAKARAVVERRLAKGKKTVRGGNGKGGPRKKLSTDDLVKTYKRSIQRQALLVKRAHACESLLRIVYGALRELMKDDHFVTLLRAERLDKMPKPLAEQVHQREAR